MQAWFDDWLKLYLANVKQRFGGRIWFAGLQGSYARDEATKNSDIDVVLILDKVTPADFRQYDDVLCSLPYRKKICGFVSGKDELFHWEPADLFQFYYDTMPLFGSLEDLKSRFTDEDVKRSVWQGACNIYHACAHNILHEKDSVILKGLYKSAFFVLQAVAYLKTGSYPRERTALAAALPPKDRKILDSGQTMKSQEGLSDQDFAAFSELLLSWASERIIGEGRTF